MNSLNGQVGFLNIANERFKALLKNCQISDIYDVEERPFARGKFAAVRKCRHKVTGHEYAAKFIRKRRRAMDVRHEIVHEIAILDLSRNCHNIVHLCEVYETPSEFVLVLELAAGGELQRLIDEEEAIPEWYVIRFMRQILHGVAYLHQHHIAHLDLKPQNLLLTAAYPVCDVKLCDFGISREIVKGIEIREIMGTPDYTAPEVLSYEPINFATDMWSLGVLTYVMLTGHTPFGGDTKQETFCNISQAVVDFPSELFGNTSCLAKDFIGRLLVKDPNARITVEECLDHQWLRKTDNFDRVIMPKTEEESAENGQEKEVSTPNSPKERPVKMRAISPNSSTTSSATSSNNDNCENLSSSPMRIVSELFSRKPIKLSHRPFLDEGVVC